MTEHEIKEPKLSDEQQRAIQDMINHFSDFPFTKYITVEMMKKYLADKNNKIN